MTGVYEPGAWFRGRLYPHRWDVSPGGRWFCYFTYNYKHNSDWPCGETYNAVSRLPWLRALAAWRETGTYSYGYHFTTDPTIWEIGQPTVGDAGPCRGVCGVAQIRPSQFPTERRRGWVESAETLPRDPDDMWDERRQVVMEKPKPGSARVTLSVRGGRWADRAWPVLMPPAPTPYRLNRGGVQHELAGVVWADWTADGRMAVATTSGMLQLRDGDSGRAVSEVALPDGEPRPQPAPAWAESW